MKEGQEWIDKCVDELIDKDAKDLPHRKQSLICYLHDKSAPFIINFYRLMVKHNREWCGG